MDDATSRGLARFNDDGCGSHDYVRNPTKPKERKMSGGFEYICFLNLRFVEGSGFKLHGICVVGRLLQPRFMYKHHIRPPESKHTSFNFPEDWVSNFMTSP